MIKNKKNTIVVNNTKEVNISMEIGFSEVANLKMMSIKVTTKMENSSNETTFNFLFIVPNPSRFSF